MMKNETIVLKFKKKWTSSGLVVRQNNIIIGTYSKNARLLRKIFSFEKLENLDAIMFRKKEKIVDYGLFELIKPLQQKKLSCKLRLSLSSENVQDVNMFVRSVCRFQNIICDISYDVHITQCDNILQIMFHDEKCSNSYEEYFIWDTYAQSTFRHQLFDNKVFENFEETRHWILSNQMGSRVIRGFQFTDSICGIYE
jgi:hypothetical protein